MTDNEITVKALKDLLEVMLCEGDLQRVSTVSHAIEHINRQKAEIERLKANEEMAEGYAEALVEYTKAEAYREFWQEAKQKGMHPEDIPDEFAIPRSFFDKVYERLVGELNG